MAYPTGKGNPPPLSSHMIKHHLRVRNVTTAVEGGERDRELRLAGQLEIEIGETMRGISASAANGDIDMLRKTLPFLRHVTNDHYLELLNEPLSAATFADHTECVEELLKWGADPTRLFNGEPAVVVAASAGHTRSLKIIIERGGNIDCRNQTGYSPLMKACASGHNEVVACLVNFGADRDIVTIPGGQTALMIAANKGNLSLCQMLLDSDISIGEKGCDREVHESHMGYTAMIFAARKDYVQIVELICSFGGNVHAKDKQGMTAMHHAAHFGKLKTFRFLWSFEGCVNDQDNKGRTPLSIAVQRGMRGIVELAVGIDRGVRGNYMGAAGKKRSSSFSFKQEGKERCSDDDLEEDDSEEDPDAARWARPLIGTADVEVKDKQGRTPLMWAVLNCRYVIVRLLMVDGGASLKPQDNEGDSAIDFAKQLKLPDMISILNQSVTDRLLRLQTLEAARVLAEKMAKKAARRAELSDSEFDFTSSEEDEDE